MAFSWNDGGIGNSTPNPHPTNAPTLSSQQTNMSSGQKLGCLGLFILVGLLGNLMVSPSDTGSTVAPPVSDTDSSVSVENSSTEDNTPVFGIREIHLVWNKNPIAAESKYLNKRIRLRGMARRTGRSQYSSGRYGRAPYIELGQTTNIVDRGEYGTDFSIDTEHLSLNLYLLDSQLPQLATIEFPKRMTLSCVVDGTDDETFTIPIPMLSKCIIQQ